MSSFHVLLPNDTSISRLLYYSTKLAEDIKEANARNKKAAAEQQRGNSQVKRNNAANRGPGGPVRWQRRR